MWSIGFLMFLVISTVVSFYIRKTSLKNDFIQIDSGSQYLRLMTWAAMSVALGLLMGSLSLNTFEASAAESVDFEFWKAMLPYLMVLSVVIVFELKRSK